MPLMFKDSDFITIYGKPVDPGADNGAKENINGEKTVQRNKRINYRQASSWLINVPFLEAAEVCECQRSLRMFTSHILVLLVLIFAHHILVLTFAAFCARLAV